MPTNHDTVLAAPAVIPGGVNSPVRAFKQVGGEPFFVARAQGPYLWDVEGNRYIDYIGSWGPMIAGHSHPAVVKAVQEMAAIGMSYGCPNPLETELAAEIIKLVPSVDLVRFVSSGTEACLSAIRLARGYTGRDRILKFAGCYHGHGDSFLVKAGSGVLTLGLPNSPGVPKALADLTITADFNDLDQVRAIFKEIGHEIAAVIVEPVVGNMGCVPPEPGFLEAILALCTERGAISIFDEVMTGCRLAAGGAQERFGLKPDMTTLGKIVGGGMPLAVYGGRADIMQVIAPLGPVYQAGTLSGNPIAVSAGLATLAHLGPALYQRLEALGARLEAGLKRGIEDAGIEACVQRVGSMITVFFSRGPVKSWGDADKADRKRFAAFHGELLRRGIYWPPAQFEAAFISGAHGEDDIDRTIEAAREAFTKV